MATSQKIRINLGTFDLAKGIAMLFVIFFHMQERYGAGQLPLINPLLPILQLTGSGLMPMFFIMSGFGFKDKSTKKMLKKTVSELIIPYLWAAAACVVFFPALHYLFVDSGSLRYCTKLTFFAFFFGLPRAGTLLGYETFSTQALWFFLALFLALNLLNQIVKIKNTVVQCILTALCVGIGYILLRLDFIFYCIPQGLMAVGFCYIGYTIKQFKLLDRGMFSIWTYVTLVPVYLLQALYGRFDMAYGDFNLLDYFAAGCSGTLFLFIGVYCSRFEWKGLDWIKQIGIHSYWIICIHSVEMLACPWFALVEALPHHLLWLAFVIEVILKIIIITTCCIILKKISQLKYKKKRMARNGK